MHQLIALGYEKTGQNPSKGVWKWFKNAKPGTEGGKREIWLKDDHDIVRLIFGYGSKNTLAFSTQQPDALAAKAAALGFVYKPKAGIKPEGVWFNAEVCKTPAQAEELFNWLDSEIDTDPSTRGWKRKTEEPGYFTKAAAFIRHCVTTEFWDPLERGSLGFDAHDDLFLVGWSISALVNKDGPLWREHLVPCVLIKEEAIRMVQAGDSDARIAVMLKQNLAIMIITQGQQEVLDKDYQTTMPPGWKFGDSIFARLDAFKMVY